MLQCFVLCHIIDQAIVMLVSACVCFFYVGASIVNLGMALDSIAFCFGVFYNCYLGTRLSISFQHVSVDVSILFGVVRGCCHRLSLLSLLIVH